MPTTTQKSKNASATAPHSPPPPDADDEAVEVPFDTEEASTENPVRKTIKDELTGYLKIKELDGSLTTPKDPTIPQAWKEVWGVVDMQKAELRLNEFKNQGKQKNPNRSLPHGRELCVCIDVSEDNEEEAKRCEALYLEMRKDWKKQFPQSKKQNDMPFKEYEAMIIANAYDDIYSKLLAQAELHDEGHKPTDRLEHYKEYTEKRRSRYEDMKKDRLERAKKNRENRRAAAHQRARDAPERKEKERAKVVAEGIAQHKKTEEFKKEQKSQTEKIKELMKKYMKKGMAMETAMDKATEEVIFA